MRGTIGDTANFTSRSQVDCSLRCDTIAYHRIAFIDFQHAEGIHLSIVAGGEQIIISLKRVGFAAIVWSCTILEGCKRCVEIVWLNSAKALNFVVGICWACCRKASITTVLHCSRIGTKRANH